MSRWKQIALAEIADVRAGSPAPQGEEYFDPNGVPFVRVQDVGRYGRTTCLLKTKDRINPHAIDTLRPAFARAGTILFPKSGAAINTNSRAILGIDAYVVSHLAMVTAKDSEVLPEWLYYWFCSFDLATLSRTTSLPSVRLSDIKKLKVPMPPLAEQRRIVARIKACMERVEEIEEHSQSIKVEIEALLPSMVYERFKELRRRVDVAKLEDVTEIKGGRSLPKGIQKDLGEDGLLLVKVGDMNVPGNERLIKFSRAYLPASKAPKKIIPPGAVIFPKRGGAIATNKKRILARPAMIDPNLMAVVAKPDQIRAEYLYYWTHTLDLAQISNGGVIPQLNRKDLAPLNIPVPDLEEQERIVAELNHAEKAWFKIKDTLQESCKKSQHLRDAILRKAFAGEL